MRGSGSVPVRGVDCFVGKLVGKCVRSCFRPHKGCRLFRHKSQRNSKEEEVSVPIRGVDCFS